MGIDELIVGKRDDILRVAARRGARKVRVFGFVARGEADETSDIDFLVELEPGRSAVRDPRERLRSVLEAIERHIQELRRHIKALPC